MDAYLGSIRAFGFNFAPYGWALCNGQLLSIASNAALYSLIGTTYGGNGTSTFALPNLNGNVIVGTGTLPAPIGSNYVIGETGGATDVTITQSTMPQHSHTFNGAFTATTADAVETQLPATTSYISNVFLQTTPSVVQADGFITPVAGNPTVQLNANSVVVAGGNQPHTNMAPYLSINFCICINGTFPSFD